MKEKITILLQALGVFVVVLTTTLTCLMFSAVIVMNLFSIDTTEGILMDGTLLSITVFIGSLFTACCIYFMNKKLL